MKSLYLPLFLIAVLVSASFANNDSIRVEQLIAEGKEKLNSGDTAFSRFFYEALSVSGKMGFSYGSLKARYYIFFSRRLSNNYSAALEGYLQLLKENQVKKYGDLTYDILSEMGYIYYNIGEYKEAFNYYDQSLKTAEHLKDKKRTALAYGNLGVLSEQWGYFDNALYYYGLAKKLHEELRDTSGIVNTLNNLAVAYLYTKQFPLAIENSRKAILLAKKSGYENGIIDASINLGAILSESGDYLSSISSNLEALKLAERIGRISDAGIALENIAYNFLQLGEYRTAEKYGLRALEKAKILDAPEALKGAHDILYQIYQKTGELKSALFHLEQVSSLKDSLSKNDLSVQVAKLDERNQIKRKIEEEKRREKERARLEQEERNRISNIQYFIILSITFMIVFGIIFARKYSVNLKFVEILLFISILMFFEFIGILVDPYTESFSGGFPLPKLAINLVLAIVIFFLDEYFDKRIKDKIIGKKY